MMIMIIIIRIIIIIIIIIIITIYSNINFLLTEWFAAAGGRWRMRA